MHQPELDCPLADVQAEMLMKELSQDEARRRKELFHFGIPSKVLQSMINKPPIGTYYNIDIQETNWRGRNRLPQHLKRLMGEANMTFARGQHDETIRLCTEIIRQGELCA